MKLSLEGNVILRYGCFQVFETLSPPKNSLAINSKLNPKPAQKAR
jgi:hypothetical protein